ncbi:cupin domain-containing protein [Longibacter sp.]|jgi:mannose-6-phosphate isomerase-like protein (cupin superfamily)|uniref:cupin domain-containing protein n=1 Tax=Longibacter sp. TaxID=2045415 RepID=UPI003EBC6043
MQKVNIRDEFASIDEYWSQHIVGEANGTLIKLAKGTGSTTWHAHDDQDEVFLVHRGTLLVELRDQTVTLEAGELLVVPRGVEHRPRAAGDVELLVLGRSITSTPEGGKPAWSATA